MTEERNSARTEDTSRSDMLAALLAAKDVTYALKPQVVAGFEYAMPADFQSELDEAQDVRAQVKEMLAEIPEEARIHMSGNVIEALKSARTFAELGGAQQAFKTALHAALEASHTDHKEKMTAEQERQARLDKLWHQIEENNKTIATASDALDPYKTDAQREEEERLQRALTAAQTPEEREAAQKNLNAFYTAHGEEWRDAAANAGDTAGTTAADTVISTNRDNIRLTGDVSSLNTEAAQERAMVASPEPQTVAFQIPAPAPTVPEAATNEPAPATPGPAAPAPAFTLSFTTVSGADSLVPNAPAGPGGGIALNA